MGLNKEPARGKRQSFAPGKDTATNWRLWENSWWRLRALVKTATPFDRPGHHIKDIKQETLKRLELHFENWLNPGTQ